MLEIISITISFVGSILLALSISKSSGASQKVGGKENYFTIIKLGLFRLGVGLLILGFFLQIVEFFIK